jgi:hypothetical protein
MTAWCGDGWWWGWEDGWGWGVGVAHPAKLAATCVVIGCRLLPELSWWQLGQLQPLHGGRMAAWCGFSLYCLHGPVGHRVVVQLLSCGCNHRCLCEYMRGCATMSHTYGLDL